MPTVTLGQMNLENAFLRYRFEGGLVRKKKGESDTAYAKRKAAEQKKTLAEFEKSGGPIEWLRTDLEDFSVISHTQRKATAAVIKAHDPDIVTVEEIENLDALRAFNTKKYFGDATFTHALSIDGNDPRGIDVGVLSNYPIVGIRTYMDDTYTSDKGKAVRVFSRDCLAVTVDVKGTPLTLFINHLKSQAMDDPARRLKQATRVAEIVKDTFGSQMSKAYFAVCGDFNQIPEDASVAPLAEATWLTDVLGTITNKNERWTHVYASKDKVKGVSQLDYILASKALAAAQQGKAVIERRGLARYKGLDPYFADAEKRILSTVDSPGTEASDHCPVFATFKL